MNDNLTETSFIPGTKMKAVRRTKQGMADEMDVRDEEENNDR